MWYKYIKREIIFLRATQSLQVASNQAQNACAYAPDFQRGANAAARINQLLKIKPEIRDPEAPEFINVVSILSLILYSPRSVLYTFI